MTHDRYQFAKIFADVPSIADAMAVLADSAGFRVDKSGPALFIVSDDVAEVEFLANNDQRVAPRDDDKPGFLFYPYFAEVVPHAEAGDPRLVDVVSRVMSALRSRGWACVVAADFEDELADPGYRA